jgi:hypothetical protein
MNLFSSNNELVGRFEFGGFARSEMDDDFAFASQLFNNHQEPCMTLSADATIADTTDRRFCVAHGRATDFLGVEHVTVRRVRGRFGGDTGNRKRRVATRFDNFIEHQVRNRVSEREAREAIEFGVAEYESRRRQAIAVAKKNARTMHAFDGTPIATTPEGMVRQSRTGHLVEVVVRKSPRVIRKDAVASVVSRPRLSSGEVRAKLGLPAKN